jgi:two-component system response regulator FixJ
MGDFHIAVVDDDDAVRDSLAVFLRQGRRRVSCFANGEAFLAAAPEDPPDLLLLDLKMPGLSGLEVLRRLGRPRFPIIMISAHGDIAAAVQAVKLGAFDFVEKPFAPESIEAAIAAARDRAEPPRAAARLADLTEREREIAAALGEGLTNKEIARRFDISPRTVEVHRARIFEKLGVRNVAGLIRLLGAV